MDNSEMDFNSIPAEVKARLLAQHLKYYMQLVDDLEDDLKIMHHRMENRRLKNRELMDTIKEQEKQIEQYQKFICENVAPKMFIGCLAPQNKAA